MSFLRTAPHSHTLPRVAACIPNTILARTPVNRLHTHHPLYRAWRLLRILATQRHLSQTLIVLALHTHHIPDTHFPSNSSAYLNPDTFDTVFVQPCFATSPYLFVMISYHSPTETVTQQHGNFCNSHMNSHR